MSCEHLDEYPGPAGDPKPQTADGCQDCLALGEDNWVHLRLCLRCGHVACCDSSPHRHATAHYGQTAGSGDPHPVMRSHEAGENWRWCFVDELVG